MENTFYVTGGTVPLHAASYLERAADKELLDALRSGEYCFVLNARQMGKSSLSVRTMAQLTEQGVKTVFVDLQKFGGANVTPEQWYLGLLSEIGRGVGLRREFLAYWREQAELSPVQRLFGALREVALPALTEKDEGSGMRDEGSGIRDDTSESHPSSLIPHPSSRLVIFVDEIDATRSLPFSTDEFFAALREFYNARVQDPAYGRIAFCLVGSALPSDLIQDRRTSPFNIGERIELRDFTEAEVLPLAEGLNRPHAQDLVKRVFYWTNGHPYLTQSLCAEIAADASVQTPKDVDRVVDRLFFEAKARERNVNLADVATRLLGSRAEGQSEEEYRAEILDLYGKAWRGQKVGDDEADRRVAVLKLSGITRTVEGCLRLRNRIYERVFDRKWIAEQMPDAEVRRQKAAYRKGLWRATAVATVILVAIGALALTALNMAHRARVASLKSEINEFRRGVAFRKAEDRRRQAEHNLYISDMNLVQKACEEGNRGRTLELLERHRKDPERGFEWDYWNRLCHQELRTLKGHTGEVVSVAYSPDGKHILTGSADQTAKVWEAQTGREIRTLTLAEPVIAVAFSPDGRYLVTSHTGKDTAKVWEVQTGKKVRALQGHAGEIWAVAFSPDGRRIVTGSEDKTAKVWDAQTGHEILTLAGKPNTSSTGGPGAVTGVAFSPDGRRILTSAYKGLPTVWDAQTGDEIFTLNSVGGSGAFSPDGRRIVLVHWNGATQVWEGQTGKELLTRHGHSGPVCSVAFSPDGRRFLTGSADKTAKVWDAQTGDEIFTLMGHTASVLSVAFSPDGGHILTGSADGTVKVWESQPREPRTLRGGGFGPVAFSPDGGHILTGSADGTAKVWETQTGREILTLKGHTTERTRVVAFSPDGRRIVTGGSGTSRIGIAQVWDAQSGQEIRVFKFPVGHGVGGVAFSPDGRRIVIGIEGVSDKNGRVWDVRTGQETLTLKFKDPSETWICAAAFSPDGRRIVTSSMDKTAKVWNATPYNPTDTPPPAR